jgi:hypothetical protein
MGACSGKKPIGPKGQGSFKPNAQVEGYQAMCSSNVCSIFFFSYVQRVGQKSTSFLSRVGCAISIFHLQLAEDKSSWTTTHLIFHVAGDGSMTQWSSG